MISDSNALAWLETSIGNLIAKWSIAPERFQRLSELAQLTRWLSRRGLPVSPQIGTLEGHLQLEVDGVSLGLQHQVPGDLLDTDDPNQVRTAGAALAHIHAALRTYPGAGTVRGTAPLQPLRARISDWLATRADDLPETVRDSVQRLIDSAPTEHLPEQLVHGDFRACGGPLSRHAVRPQACSDAVRRAACARPG